MLDRRDLLVDIPWWGWIPVGHVEGDQVKGVVPGALDVGMVVFK